LERDDSAAAKLALANAALFGEGDVAATMGYLEQAGAVDPTLGPAVERRCEFLAGLADDPPEAVRMFYNGGSDVHRDLIDRYPKSAAATEAVIGIGTFDELMAFLKNERKHPRWPEAYVYAVREALYDVNYENEVGRSKKELDLLKKDIKHYLKLTADADKRAQTLTHLADCFYHAGEFKTAAELYQDSLAEAPEGVFEGYDYLRLGDCAVATGDHEAAIGYYAKCAALADWWTDGADDALVGYAAIREGDSRRHFLDYLDERGPYEYLTLEAGDLDGDGEADIAVLVQKNEEPNELYYFLRAGEEFAGEFLIEGKPSLWMCEILEVSDTGPALLSCRETADAEEGRVTHEVLYRYDGSAMREVGRYKIEETRSAEPGYKYEATLAFVDAPALTITVGGMVKTAEDETIFADEYVWDEDNFAFVPVE
jgi:tetratricopeptide (TPR) repeat protein